MDTDQRDLSWLAGFIDGEGSFHFRRHAGKRAGGFNYYYPAIRISNTHEGTLATVTAILDRSGLEYLVYWRHPKNGTKSSWDIEARKGAASTKAWLETLIPHLRTKRSQAEDVLEFLRLRAADTTRRDYSDEEYAILVRMAKRSVIQPRQGFEPISECKHGHPLTEATTYLHRGKRSCCACRAISSQHEAARRKETRRLQREAEGRGRWERRAATSRLASTE
jgi:hypothetical protein